MKHILQMICFCLLLIGVMYFMYPKPTLLDNFSFSDIVYDRNKNILRISLSADDKYRVFTPIHQIPTDAQKALLMYEDKNFKTHIGVDLKAFFRIVITIKTQCLFSIIKNREYSLIKRQKTLWIITGTQWF